MLSSYREWSFVKPLHVKLILVLAVLSLVLSSAQPPQRQSPLTHPVDNSRNLVVVTIDGFRWVELFAGADESLINDPELNSDTGTTKMLFWDDDPQIRRKLLMPFMWSVVAGRGQIWGNRRLGNKVNTANIYHLSYPGYNELLTGTTDLRITDNSKTLNPHANVLAFLNLQPELQGKVAAFTSWDVFPYILNEEKSDILLNSGYEKMPEDLNSNTASKLNWLQTDGVQERGATRHDQISFLAAREYLQQSRPRVLFLGLGETDEYAHHKQYGSYLQQANRIDRMLADLWHWIQSTPGYKNQTTLLITTDHGRGTRADKWSSHNSFIRGSSQTWMALIGPGIEAKGEMDEDSQLYQQDLPSFMAAVLGHQFEPASWTGLSGRQSAED